VYEAFERLRYEAAEPMELASLWCLGYPWGPVNYLTIEKITKLPYGPQFRHRKLLKMIEI